MVAVMLAAQAVLPVKHVAALEAGGDVVGLAHGARGRRGGCEKARNAEEDVITERPAGEPAGLAVPAS